MRYALIALLLSGCAATEEWRADRAIARYSPYCEKIGFARDSDQWRQCISQQDASGRTTGAAALGVLKPKP